MQTSKQPNPSSNVPDEMTAKQIAAMKKQLKVANARLLSIEREGQKLRADVEALERS